MKDNRFNSFHPPQRMLMGRGPSDVHPHILEALSRSTIGHLDSLFIKMMDEIKELLRYAFQTSNEVTIPISAPGSAGMEICFVNLVEPGDKVIVCANGVFGADAPRFFAKAEMGSVRFQQRKIVAIIACCGPRRPASASLRNTLVNSGLLHTAPTNDWTPFRDALCFTFAFASATTSVKHPATATATRGSSYTAHPLRYFASCTPSRRSLGYRRTFF